MNARSWGIALLVAMLSTGVGWGFEARFADSAGNWLGRVWEGQRAHIVVKDPDKGACGISEFLADLVIVDFKTGAYIARTGQTFRELGGIGSGLYFWVAGPGSTTKISVPIGWRADFTDAPEGMTHVLQPPGTNLWAGGAWEYVDEGLLFAGATNSVYDPTLNDTLEAAYDAYRFGIQTLPWTDPWDRLPWDRTVVRVNLESEERRVAGRLENMDTLILIVRDRTDERNLAQDQVKIVDTVGKLSVTPARVDYSCATCKNITVTIEDKDENLNCNEIEYVPFFVIINPGSWNEDPSTGRDFCTLLRHGGVTESGERIHEIIRWYNIYRTSWTIGGWTYTTGRFVDYRDAPWAKPMSRQVLKAVFYAVETSVDSGVFTFDFGSLEDLQEALWLSRGDRLTPGMTIAFYYIDPNDFDDMDLTTIQVGSRDRSQVFITNEQGTPVTEVKIGHGGLYVRVLDGDANLNACCQDVVVVHLCDPHGEDDAEYIVLDEISNDSGIFFTQSGIPLLPVWDAVAGYQLVYDDWRMQAFNEDTVFAQYNSVDYVRAHLNTLGDGDPNDYDAAAFFFPPMINYDAVTGAGAARNQYWDVSYAKVKVYDTQVFDGTTHHMRFLNGQYQPVTEIPVSGSLYLEVTDLDQNEHPLMRELIFGGWNKDANAGDDATERNEDSMAIWGRNRDGLLNLALPGTDPFRPGETILWPSSISGIPETVKIFMFNAQRGTWERMDLRETAVGSGIFRSTTCVLVADARNPGQGNLGSRPGDTIMAFYQDPSNHSDISIISIKVSEGGAGGITPPTVALGVTFDRANYNPGDTATITVTDEQYAGAMEITGTKPLILKKADGTELASWTTIPAVPGQPGRFRVSYVLPATVTGTIIAVYTDPMIPTRTAQAQATVAAPVLTGVTDVKPVPEVFSTSTTFTVYAVPAGAVPSKVTITVYDLTGKQVATLTGTNTGTVSWNGGTLRNGAYIYVAVVEGGNPIRSWTFKGFVYIKRCPTCGG